VKFYKEYFAPPPSPGDGTYGNPRKYVENMKKYGENK